MPIFKASLQHHKHSLSQAIIPVPENIAKQLINKRADKRAVCSINNDHEYHCALLPDGEGGHYIMVNKKIRKKLNLDFGDEVQLFLKVDPTKYGMPLPKEFKEVLETDPEGQSFFESLTPGKQRSLIHIVGKVKSSDLRITKSLVILEHLKRHNGELDYKILNNDFKNERLN
jgi:hypothetical protein